MRQSSIIFIALLVSFSSVGQTAKEQAFQSTLKRVVTALTGRDSAKLSTYIDRNTGVYILNRIGVVDTYKHFPRLGFSDTSYPNAPFYDHVKMKSLNYSSLPTFDCKKWTKTGTFVDTTKTDHLLSSIAKNLNKEFKNKLPEATIDKFYKLETKSRRIIIADNDWNELIIYLSFINNKWVLTIIDKATCDCSN